MPMITTDTSLHRVAEYTVSRVALGLYGLAVGVLLGFASFFLGVELVVDWRLLLWLAVALVVVIILHEGAHGLTAVLLGYRPFFGLEPPLVYVTFQERVKRDHFILIALAPLILLDALFAMSYAAGILQTFAALGFGLNTIGAIGDVWILTRVLRHRRSDWIQDTKAGVEIWRAPVTS
jgi:hypothetical protein